MNARTQRRREARARSLTASAMRNAPRWTPELDADVVLTAGHYTEITALAKRLGLASATVQARWHVVRAR